MAREKIDDLYRGQDALMAELYLYHSERAARIGLPFDDYIAEKLAIKARQFNTILNDPALIDRIDSDEQDRQAREYRRGAKGGL